MNVGRICNFWLIFGWILADLWFDNHKKVEGKEDNSGFECFGERTTSVDISEDALENLDVGAYERHQLERRRLQAKQLHFERRKAWLRKNQALLRVFLSYCSLHGAKGGGVTSVRMELLFLLQESQQVRSIDAGVNKNFLKEAKLVVSLCRSLPSSSCSPLCLCPLHCLCCLLALPPPRPS